MIVELLISLAIAFVWTEWIGHMPDSLPKIGGVLAVVLVAVVSLEWLLGRAGCELPWHRKPPCP